MEEKEEEEEEGCSEEAKQMPGQLKGSGNVTNAVNLSKPPAVMMFLQRYTSLPGGAEQRYSEAQT